MLNKIPVYKKLSRLIHVQFLLQRYIVIFYGIYLNMAPISLSSLETRMKVLSPNYYDFKNLSVPTQTFSFLFHCMYLKSVFLTILKAVWNTKVKSVSYTMVYTPCFEEIYCKIRSQSGCFLWNEFPKGGTLLYRSNTVETRIKEPRFFLDSLNRFLIKWLLL